MFVHDRPSATILRCCFSGSQIGLRLVIYEFRAEMLGLKRLTALALALLAPNIHGLPWEPRPLGVTSAPGWLFTEATGVKRTFRGYKKAGVCLFEARVSIKVRCMWGVGVYVGDDSGRLCV